MRKPRAGRAVAGARGREDGSAGGWGTLAGGTRGWRGPLGTRGRVPGRPLGGKAWVWRGGLSLRGPPPTATQSCPGHLRGDAAPRRSCQPGPGQEDSECGPGSRAGHPGIRRVRTPVRCGGTLPFHPEAEAQEAPPSPNALENVVSVSNRGESRPPWLGSVPSGAGRLTRSVGSGAPRRRAPCPPNPPRPQSPGSGRARCAKRLGSCVKSRPTGPPAPHPPTHPRHPRARRPGSEAAVLG